MKHATLVTTPRFSILGAGRVVLGLGRLNTPYRVRVRVGGGRELEEGETPRA